MATLNYKMKDFTYLKQIETNNYVKKKFGPILILLIFKYVNIILIQIIINIHYENNVKIDTFLYKTYFHII
jgi:hypothetical protein